MTHHLPEGPVGFTRRTALLLVLLCATQFLLILDISVANVALPSISSELRMERDDLTWVLTLYVLVFGGLMILGGRLADVFGTKRILILGLLIFTAGSSAAGLATAPELLLAGRAVQGAGAALASPSALALVTTVFEGRTRTRALAVWAGVGGAGAVAGVLIGGVLVAGVGWRWAFLGSAALGIGALAALARALPAAPPRSEPRRRVDLIGALLVTAATVGLVAALNGTGPTGWLLGGSVLGYLLFVRHERAHPEPLVAPALVRSRPVVAGLVLMLTASALMAGNFLLGSFYLQNSAGWGPLATGLAFAPSALGTVVGAHLGGTVVHSAGPRIAAVSGLAVVAGGATAAALWLSPVLVVAGLTVSGLGLGATFVSATSTALSRAEPDTAGVLSGVVNASHEIGAAFGIATLSLVALGGETIARVRPADFSLAWTVAAAFAAAAAAVALAAVPGGRPAPTSRFVH